MAMWKENICGPKQQVIVVDHEYYFGFCSAPLAHSAISDLEVNQCSQLPHWPHCSSHVVIVPCIYSICAFPFSLKLLGTGL